MIKYISRKNLKFHAHFNATRPISNVWLHGVLYYKFNGLVFSKFPVDLWQDICKWQTERLAGTANKMNLMNWVLGLAAKHSTLDKCNCPILGYHESKIDNFSTSAFVFEPLIPSGIYRLDLAFTENKRAPLLSAQIFFSVSDYRIEKI